jgi:hypothetical protein
MPPQSLRKLSANLMRMLLHAGFVPPDELPDCMVELLAPEFEPARVRQVSVELLSKMLAKRRREMRSWPRVTDCDRLDAAFEELHTLGILARHELGERDEEIGEEFAELDGRWEGIPITGYVFYTAEDILIACLKGVLPLHIGTFDESLDDDVQNAMRRDVYVLICDVLMEHGWHCDGAAIRAEVRSSR